VAICSNSHRDARKLPLASVSSWPAAAPVSVCEELPPSNLVINLDDGSRRFLRAPESGHLPTVVAVSFPIR